MPAWVWLGLFIFSVYLKSMEHTKISFVLSNSEQSDMLVALLADLGFEGFEETDSSLLAYIATQGYDPLAVSAIAEQLNIEFSEVVVQAQNWNALWESNFQPVQIEDFCIIRADFHEQLQDIAYDIIITPKMSFGTGHHSTTRLVIKMMKGMELTGKSVLDFGTGTGVLAIFAEMRGASSIMAIDIDPWPVENTKENVVRNGCKHITAALGSLDIVAHATYDVLLANINRHILLHYMPLMFALVNTGGDLVMSGLLVEDEPIIHNAALAVGFVFSAINEENGWIALHYKKG